MFSITSGKGFKVRLPNGITLSTQFGYRDYCDNYDSELLANITFNGKVLSNVDSDDAEVAILFCENFITDKVLGNENDTKGRVKMDEWLDILQKCLQFDTSNLDCLKIKRER